jgi:hypothetical protein
MVVFLPGSSMDIWIFILIPNRKFSHVNNRDIEIQERENNMIYLVQQGENGPIKIGYTDDKLDNRIKALQTANPYPLHVIITIPGDQNTESHLHKKFNKYKLCGEWFKIEMLEELFIVPSNEILTLEEIHMQQKNLHDLLYNSWSEKNQKERSK